MTTEPFSDEFWAVHRHLLRWDAHTDRVHLTPAGVAEYQPLFAQYRIPYARSMPRTAFCTAVRQLNQRQLEANDRLLQSLAASSDVTVEEQAFLNELLGESATSSAPAAVAVKATVIDLVAYRRRMQR